MKKIIKKLGIAILLAGMSVTTVYGTVLYENRTQETITKGVIHINDKLLLSSGWRNVNVLKIDLSDSNVALKPIQATNGTDRQTILKMTVDSGAVAGINADYFDMSSKKTPSLGMLIENGNLSHGYNSNYYSLGIKKNMGTFLIDNDNMPEMGYYGVSIRMLSDGKLVGTAGAKNNVLNSITRPIVIDNTYYTTTNSIVSAHPTIYTIVVENNVITYKSKAGEGVTIPANGFAIVIPENMANTYYSKLDIGSNLTIDENLYLNDGLTKAVTDMKLGIGGSGLIMKNGAAYTGAAHSVTPNSRVARTVVATIKNSNEILLVTVDKSSSSKGATQSELIEILKRYHVQDAMYFDGGGSTTFVSRNEGSFSPTLQNKPSDGSARRVVNGIGVFTTSPTGGLAHLIFKSNMTRTFTGHGVNLYLKGTDANNNPVTVPSQQVKYTVSGAKGRFNGSTFIPEGPGQATITASVGQVTAQLVVTVTDKPAALSIDPAYLEMNAGTSKNVNVYGIDNSGYKILLNNEKITWTSTNNQIKGSNNSISGNTSGIARLTADYKGAKGTIDVIVGGKNILLESFEKSTAQFQGAPAQVKGDIFPVKDITAEGSQSIKMTYTFNPSKSRQVASAVFKNAINLPSDASGISLQLYGRKQGHGAKLQLIDAEGKEYSLEITNNINFSGWKKFDLILPSELVLPAKIKKLNIYTEQSSREVKTAVYLDNICAIKGFRDGKGNTKSDYLGDSSYKETIQAPINNQYIINVVGPTKTSAITLNSQQAASVSSQLSENASLVLKASQSNSSQLALKVNNYTYTNTYQTNIQGNTKFIMLGTGTGSIRTTQESGWVNLQKSVDSAANIKNLIIITSVNPLTGFTDALEGQAFHDYLKKVRLETGKNIFVIYAGGTQPEVILEDGIRYIRTNGISSTTGNYQNGSFVKLKIDGDQVYYTIENFK